MEDKLTELIKNALEEDIGKGDITTGAVIPAGLNGKGNFLLKADGVISGLKVAERVFELTDPSLYFTAFVNDTEKHSAGKVIAAVTGKISSILTAERTALNFLQRMSGIATATDKLAGLVSHTRAKILDTRKTAPGLRLTDKMAVRSGGGTNHRHGLYDMFLIKDNHIAAAGSITRAVESCRNYNKTNHTAFRIEVETKNLDEVEEAAESGADIIMLDNFDVPGMRKAVAIINGRALVEASGMVNENTVKVIAETGVDFISAGALTHSVKALDISLEIVTE